MSGAGYKVKNAEPAREDHAVMWTDDLRALAAETKAQASPAPPWNPPRGGSVFTKGSNDGHLGVPETPSDPRSSETLCQITL